MIFSLGVVVPTWPADQVAEFLANQAAGRPRDDDVKP
jgi:hypothetical protein